MASKNPLLSLPREHIQKIYNITSRAFGIAIRMLSDPSKTGGYFCLLDIKTGAILATFLLGSVDPLKAKRCKRLAEENAQRLHLHCQQGSPIHFSSYESRNVAKDEWGGAVKGIRYIYSFSGLPEKYDEAISLSTGVTIRDIDGNIAEKIMIDSGEIGYTHPARKIIEAMR